MRKTQDFQQIDNPMNPRSGRLGRGPAPDRRFNRNCRMRDRSFLLPLYWL